MFSLILLIAAIVLFILAAIPGQAGLGRFNLLPAGLACMAGAMLASRTSL